MPEAVIVATGRTPIGRANKGSLVECRPDDLSALVIRAVLEKVPQLDPAQVEDVLLGCGQPGGEAGYNVARVAAILAGLVDVPGVTVNRYCSSSLQTIRMAAHAIRAGEGDVFVAAGVETVSRYIHGASDTGPHNVEFARAEERTKLRAPAVTESWTPPEGLPDVYIAMGQTAENVAEYEKVSRLEMDEFAAAVPEACRHLAGERLLRARDHPGHARRWHRGHQGRRATPEHDPRGPVQPAARLPRGWDRHRGQRLPAQRRGGGRHRHERHQGQGSWASPRWPASWPAASRASTPRSWASGPIEACRQTLARANMTIDDIDLVEINEAFAAQVIPSAKHLDISWDKLNVNGGAIALGHPFGQTGARIMTTLLNGLEDAGKTYGLESMCVGGGQGMAMIVERLS